MRACGMMPNAFFAGGLWLAWSAGVVFLTRILLVWIFMRYFPAKKAYAAAYLTFPVLLLIGVIVAVASGLTMRGFDGAQWGHWAGYAVLFFTPLGLPVLAGVPIVMLSDVVRRPWRVWP